MRRAEDCAGNFSESLRVRCWNRYTFATGRRLFQEAGHPHFTSGPRQRVGRRFMDARAAHDASSDEARCHANGVVHRPVRPAGRRGRAHPFALGGAGLRVRPRDRADQPEDRLRRRFGNPSRHPAGGNSGADPPGDPDGASARSFGRAPPRPISPGSGACGHGVRSSGGPACHGLSGAGCRSSPPPHRLPGLPQRLRHDAVARARRGAACAGSTPRAAMEALASGLPAIVADEDGAKDPVRPGVAGALVPARAPDAFAGGDAASSCPSFASA